MDAKHMHMHVCNAVCRAPQTTHKLRKGGKSNLYHHNLPLSNADQCHDISLSILLGICLARMRRCHFDALLYLSRLDALHDLDRS